MGAPGVDAVYGHGMLNIERAFNPAAIGGPIDGEPGDGNPPVVDPCDDTVVDPIVGYPIGSPPGDVWYDGKGDRHVSHGVPQNGFRSCVPDDPPVVVDPPAGCDPNVSFCDPGYPIGTPGDGIWYDGRGNHYYLSLIHI